MKTLRKDLLVLHKSLTSPMLDRQDRLKQNGIESYGKAIRNESPLHRRVQRSVLKHRPRDAETHRLGSMAASRLLRLLGHQPLGEKVLAGL